MGYPSRAGKKLELRQRASGLPRGVIVAKSTIMLVAREDSWGIQIDPRLLAVRGAIRCVITGDNPGEGALSAGLYLER
jgi:hypothetical protein